MNYYCYCIKDANLALDVNLVKKQNHEILPPQSEQDSLILRC